METTRIAGERGCRVVIGVRAFERDVAEGSDDNNWLSGTVEVVQGAFRGSTSASFIVDDLSRFHAEFVQVMRRAGPSASFTPMEDTLALRIEVDRAGRAMVLGKLRDSDTLGAGMTFQFESDLTFLASAQSDLERVVAAFPCR